MHQSKNEQNQEALPASKDYKNVEIDIVKVIKTKISSDIGIEMANKFQKVSQNGVEIKAFAKTTSNSISFI